MPTSRTITETIRTHTDDPVIMQLPEPDLLAVFVNMLSILLIDFIFNSLQNY